MTVIPNSFQTPNDHVDQAMCYLTGDEYKVLNFAVRHILGWQKNLERKFGYISLSMFENGFTTNNGFVSRGVGLGRQSIINILKTLVEYGLLIRVGGVTQDGQAWAVGEDPNWDALENRKKKAADSRKQQTANARTARTNKLAGLSDNTQRGNVQHTTGGNVQHTGGGNVEQTRGGLSDNTGGVMSNNTESNTYINPSINTYTNTLPADAGGEDFSELEDHDLVEPVPAETPTIAASASPIRETVEMTPNDVRHKNPAPPAPTPKSAAPLNPSRPSNPMYDAIFKVWKLAAGMNGDMQKMLEGVATKKGYKEYNLEIPVTPEELLDWAAWWRHTELNGDTTKNMLGVREKIQSSITYWQMIGKPKAPAPAVKPEHRLFKAGDQVPASRPSVNDIKDPRVRESIRQIAAAKRMPDLQFDAQGNVLP